MQPKDLTTNWSFLKYDRSLIRSYDIEVFAKFWSVIFSKRNENGEWVEDYKVNSKNFDTNEMRTYIDKHILVAYNGHSYDDRVLMHILRTNGACSEVKRLNDIIIGTKHTDKTMQDYIRKRYPVDRSFKSIDTMKELKSNKENPLSLKMIEANMGLAIHETDVDFSYDGEFTDEMIELNESYNSYDVEVNGLVFDDRESFFQAKSQLVEWVLEKGTPNKWDTYWSLMKTTNASLVGKLYYHPDIKKFTFNIDDFDVPDDIKDYWKSAAEMVRNGENPPPYVFHMYGCEITISTGGLHVVRNGKKVFTCELNEIIDEPDEQSMYPWLMILAEIFGVKTELLKEQLQTRVKIKHSKDPDDQKLQYILKIIINTLFGILGDKFNMIYNPEARMYICFKGQEVCLKMMEIGARYGESIQSNTDATMFKYRTDYPVFEDENGNLCQLPPVEEAFKKLDEETGLITEHTYFTKVVQKDVNNYITLSPDGKIEARGAHRNNNASNIYKDNNCSIVNLAVQHYLIHGTPIHETVEANVDNVKLYMYNASISKKYEGIGFFEPIPDTEEGLLEKLRGIWKNTDDVNEKKKLVCRELNKILIKFNWYNPNVFTEDVYLQDVLTILLRKYNWTNPIELAEADYLPYMLDVKLERNSLYGFISAWRTYIETNTDLFLPEKAYAIDIKDWCNERTLKATAKVNVARTFPVIPHKCKRDYGMLRKIKSVETNEYHKFPKLSDNMAIFNEDLSIPEVQEEIKECIDLQYYVDLAKKVAHSFTKI